MLYIISPKQNEFFCIAGAVEVTVYKVPYRRALGLAFGSSARASKIILQGRSQDVSLRGVSVQAKRAGYAGTFLGERSESVLPAEGEKFLGLTARKTST